MWVFKSWVLRRTFGARREEFAGIKLYDDKLHDLYFSPRVIVMEIDKDMLGKASDSNGEEDKLMQVFDGKKCRRT